MTRKRNREQQRTRVPLNEFVGDRVRAVYHDEYNPRYADNPVITALPDTVREPIDLAALLRVTPLIPDNAKSLGDLRRRDLNRNIRDIYIAMASDDEVHFRMMQSLREGLADRNPSRPEYWRNMNRIIEGDWEAAPRSRGRRGASSPKGFFLYGLSGTGKTTVLTSILQATLPQVIEHEEFRGQPFPFTQLVWLYTRAPLGGSILQYVDNVLSSIDALLGTSYRREYIGPETVKASRTNVMIRHLKRVASMHALGLLVIDDVQVLADAKFRDRADFVNFIESLVDTIGLPVLQIGTPKAFSLIESSSRTARRGAGQGDLEWQRLRRDEEFAYVLGELWKYKLVDRGPDEPSEEIIDVFYELTQGIADYVIKLFVFSQDWAIREGIEEITEAVIRDAFDDSFGAARSILQSIRDGNVDEVEQKEGGAVRVHWKHPNQSGTSPREPSETRQAPAEEDAEATFPDGPNEGAVDQRQDSAEASHTQSPKGPSTRSHRPKRGPSSEGSRQLPNQDSGAQDDAPEAADANASQHSYDAALKAGLIAGEAENAALGDHSTREDC